MRVPDWWHFLLLALAAYRCARLVGWDDWPPVVKARRWVLGEYWVANEAADEPALPGKTPSSEAEGVRPAWRRPTLAHLVHCPFCLGWWTALAWYVAWLFAPHATSYAAAPFALAAVAALVARNLDP